MASGWRIVPQSHARDAFDGEGARRYGGRWNSVGTPLIYASEHKSLAALEILVHVDLLRPPFYKAFSFEYDDGLLERIPLAKMPKLWREAPPGPATMQIGDEWIRETRSAVLVVPSVIIPEEWNCLLNPTHPDFRKIKIASATDFAFDPRLLK
jgi:RES domain-containing protein